MEYGEEKRVHTIYGVTIFSRVDTEGYFSKSFVVKSQSFRSFRFSD